MCEWLRRRSCSLWYKYRDHWCRCPPLTFEWYDDERVIEKAGFVVGIAEESCDHLLIGGRLSRSPSERE
jgi:hypothetical protein